MQEYIDLAHPFKVFVHIGAHFKSSLVEVENSGKESGSQHLEYHPLINGRAHSLGQGKAILNASFRETYDKFLSVKVQKPFLTNEEKLAFVYYLQLQDRMEEAINLFNKV